MTETPPAAVTYIGLPISSGGAHSLARMSRRDAFVQTRRFIDTCTHLESPLTCEFSVYTEPELPPVPKERLELVRRFGPYGRVDENGVAEALEFLDAIAPQPTNRWGMAPIWFRALGEFRILDPATGRPLPGQEPRRFGGVEYERHLPLGSSRLGLTLHNHATLAVDLCIPCADESILRRVVPWLQAHLPFRFSPKQWRAWTPTRSGGYKARRFPMPSDIR